jgi:hypothetical protein
MSQLDVSKPSVLLELLQQGRKWGISIEKASPLHEQGILQKTTTVSKNSGANTVIDVGEIVYEDLPHEGEEADEYIPFGYAEDYQELRKEVTQEVVICLNSSKYINNDNDESLSARRIELNSFFVVPENSSSSRPSVSFVNSASDLFSYLPSFSESSLSLYLNERKSFKIKFLLPPNYLGSLNRLLVMKFVCNIQINDFSAVNMSFQVGVLLLGCVVRKAAHHVHNLPLVGRFWEPKSNSLSGGSFPVTSSVDALSLSTEAAPFVPLSKMLFFNFQVNLI